MVYCSNCGMPIPDENKFCNYCGFPRPSVKLEKPAPTEPQKNEVTEQPKPNITEAAKTAVATAATQPQQPVSTTVSATSRPVVNNTFINNVGFWGAIMLLVGFFLPFYKALIDGSVTDISLATMAGSVDSGVGRILLFLLPVSAVILIIQAFGYPFPPIVANIAKILPLLLMVFTLGATMREDETGQSLGSFFEIAQIGVYLTLLGSLLMLFFRRKK